MFCSTDAAFGCGSPTVDLTTVDQLPHAQPMKIRPALVLKLVFSIGVIAIVVLSLLPASQTSSLFPDKFEHLVAYALVGLVGGFAFPARRATLWLIGGLVILAIALEIGQVFAPGRSTDVADAVFSGLGACFALVPKLVPRR
jgi:VanZ family protein